MERFAHPHASSTYLLCIPHVHRFCTALHTACILGKHRDKGDRLSDDPAEGTSTSGWNWRPRHTSQFWICDLLLIHFDPFCPCPLRPGRCPPKRRGRQSQSLWESCQKQKTTKSTKATKTMKTIKTKEKPKEKPKATIKKAIGKKKSSWLKVGTKMEAAESCVHVTTCHYMSHCTTYATRVKAWSNHDQFFLSTNGRQKRSTCLWVFSVGHCQEAKKTPRKMLQAYLSSVNFNIDVAMCCVARKSELPTSRCNKFLKVWVLSDCANIFYVQELGLITGVGLRRLV